MALNAPELPLGSGLVAAPPRRGLRFLVVRLPAFRLERCGWYASDCVGLIAEERNALRIVALTPAARQAGLRVGMMAAEARALVSEVELELLDGQGEERDWAELLRAFEVLGDRVRTFSSDEIAVELSTVAHVHGGEEGVLAHARRLADSFGHLCQLAIADHPLAAAVLASSSGGDVRVLPGEGRAVLEDRSVHLLRPSDTLRAAWAALGISRIGQWAALDPASVAGRFGEEGVRLHRVARGHGVPAWTAPPVPEGQERLVLPVDDVLVSVDEVMGCIIPGIHTLRDLLAAREQAVSALDVRLELERGPAVHVTVTVGRPTRAPDVLTRLIRDRLERLHLDAPVLGVTLAVREVVTGTGWQEELLARREAQEPLGELVARLTDVLGDEAVGHAVCSDSWRPEAAGVFEPVSSSGRARPVVAEDDDDPAYPHDAHRVEERLARPALLRNPPLPCRVRCRDGYPAAIRSEHGWWPVVRAMGPERLEGDWWQPDGGFQRDYWVVELADRTLWLFYERSQWFIHGWFD